MRFVFFLLLLGCTAKDPHKTEIKRVISLAPSLTEIVFFIKADDRLVGVTTYCNYPAAAKKIKKVGDFSNPSLELIISAKPDIVLLTLPEQRRIKAEIEKLAIRTFVSQPHNVRDIIEEIDELAKILSVDSPRESLLQIYNRSVDEKRKPTVYVELAMNPLISIGKNSFLDDVIQISGGRNLFSDIGNEFPVVSWEEVLKRNPDIILIFHPQDYDKRAGWKGLKAVQSNMVYSDLDQDVFLRPGPRIFDAIEILRSIVSK